MTRLKGSIVYITEHILPWLVLAILLAYTFARFFEHPYAGFRWDGNGRVFYVFVEGNPANPIQVGDRLIQAGSVRWVDFQADYRVTIFEGVQPGQVVPIVVERAGQQITIPWRFPGQNRGELLDQVVSEVWLAFVFWLMGTLTLFHLRPKNQAWILTIAFNYLTAIWIAVGGGASFYHLWYSAFLLRISIWFCLPVYLHFHWVFPRPLGRLPTAVVWGGYIGATILALSECFQLLPSSFYLLGFLLAIGGSLLLLIAHAILQPAARRDLGRLLTITLLALILPIVPPIIGTLNISPNTLNIPTESPILGLLGLPFVPLAYFYAAYRRQLGELELRINRLISTYLFLVLLGAVGLPLIMLASLQITLPGAAIIIGSIVAVFTALISILGFPYFQSFVEHRLLGIPLLPRSLVGIFAARITTSTSLPRLVLLLQDEILPTLLVRQFVFLRFDRDQARVVFATGVTEAEIPEMAALLSLVAQEGRYRPVDPTSETQPYPWIRLVMTLKLQEDLIGLWLLGHRDPDDLYSQTEIPLIQSLANQTVIALSNILQTERLREMYQADVNRHEEERLRLALDLHDSILNQLAAMLMNLDESSLTPGFQSSYDGLSDRLREIVSGLRPPMLNYGLKPALEELAENQMERSQDRVKVSVNLQSDEIRYAPMIELHLFRIIQEGCENALRHAQAKTISISGRLDPQQIDLQLEDDGVGFDAHEGAALDDLIAHKHFGLAGMVERASLIGGEVRIESAPGKGTHIRVSWRPSEV